MVTQLSIQAGYEPTETESEDQLGAGRQARGDRGLHFVALVSCYVGGGLGLTQQSRTMKHSRPGPGTRHQGTVAQVGHSGPSP